MNRHQNTFMDNEIYKRLSNVNHILIQLENKIKWDKLNKVVSVADYRNSRHFGRDSFSPETICRIFIIQHIYGYSDREMEDHLKFNVLYLRFCKLSFEASVPDHSTLCRWRERFSKFDLFQKIFDEFNNQLIDQGLMLKNAVIVDASLIESAAKPIKKPKLDDKNPTFPNNDSDPETTKQVQNPKDPEATWKYKNKRSIFGFQAFTAVNKERFVQHVHLTPANEYEGKELKKIIERIKPAKSASVLGDKAYFSNANIDMLAEKGLRASIMRQIHQNDLLKDIWTHFNKIMSRERYKIEQLFGIFKCKYNLRRAKYYGLRKTENQWLMTAFVHNLARSLK